MGEFLVLDPSQMVGLIDELERRGAVERRADPRDRRWKIIAPTAAGRMLYAEAEEVVAGATEHSLARLAPAEREQRRQLLTQVAF